MIIKNSNKILTVFDTPQENDAFIYSCGYDERIKVFFTKEDKKVIMKKETDYAK